MGDIFGGGSSVNIPAPQQVDIGTLQNQATAASRQNLTNSLGLQSQVFPNLNAAQNQAISSVSSNVGNPVSFNPAVAAPIGSNPGLTAANGFITGNNQALLNGQIPADVQAAIARQAGSGAFQSGLRGSGLANITAADLGLTGLQLQNQAFNNALSAGQTTQQGNLAQQQLQTSVNEFNSQYGANVDLQNRAQNQNALGLLGSFSLPASGLTPSDIASISVGQTNANNAYSQQAAALAAQQKNANKSGFGSLLGTVGGLALAPFTGGGSLAALAGGALGSGIGSLFGGGGSTNPFANATDPFYNSNVNWSRP